MAQKNMWIISHLLSTYIISYRDSHEVFEAESRSYSLPLAEKVAALSNLPIDDLVDRIVDVIGKLADYSDVPCPECGNSLRVENNATVG